MHHPVQVGGDCKLGENTTFAEREKFEPRLRFPSGAAQLVNLCRRCRLSASEAYTRGFPCHKSLLRHLRAVWFHGVAVLNDCFGSSAAAQ